MQEEPCGVVELKPHTLTLYLSLTASGVVIDNYDVFKDICYLLMLGVGVGFSVEKKHVMKLPKVRGNVDIIHKSYSSVPKSLRKRKY